MQITCDKCTKVFEPTQNMLIEHELTGGLREVFYSCPSCKTKFHIGYHNSETKNLQKLIRKAENGRNQVKAEEYRTKLKKCMDELNNRL